MPNNRTEHARRSIFISNQYRHRETRFEIAINEIDMKKPKDEKSLAISLYEAEIVTGTDAGTIKRNLMRNGFAVQAGVPIPLVKLFGIYVGAEQAAKVRNLELDADQKERDAKTELGELVDVEEVELYTNERFVSPLIQAMDAAPNAVDREWIEKTIKPILRGGFKLKKKK